MESFPRARCMETSHQGEGKAMSSVTALTTSILLSEMVIDFRLDTAVLAESQNFLFLFFFFAEGSASHRQGQRPVNTESVFGVRPHGM